MFSARFISSRPAANTSVHRLETFQLPLMIQVSCHILGPVPPPDDLAARALEPSVLWRGVHGADLFIQTHPSRGSVQPSPRQRLLLEPISDEWGWVLEDTESPHGTGAHSCPVLVTTYSMGAPDACACQCGGNACLSRTDLHLNRLRALPAPAPAGSQQLSCFRAVYLCCGVPFYLWQVMRFS